MKNGVSLVCIVLQLTYTFYPLCISCSPSDVQPTMLSKVTNW